MSATQEVFEHGAFYTDAKSGTRWRFWYGMWLRKTGKRLPALLPCPFCTGRPDLTRILRDGATDGEPDAWAYFLRCRSCAAESGWQKSETGAVTWWNMRGGAGKG